MNFLVDAHVFDGSYQGTRTYIKGLYTELIKLSPDSTFFFIAGDTDSLIEEFGTHSNAKFVSLKFGKILRLLVEIPFIIWKYKIDYAHFQYVVPPIKNCKQIVTIHDILFKDYPSYFPLQYRIINDFLFKISAKRADVIFTVSDYSKERISFHYKIPDQLIGVTKNGIVDPTYSKQDDIDIRIKYKLTRFILYVSRVEPRKNHQTLLRAYKELKLWESNYQLVFVGKRDFLFKTLDKEINNCPPECRSQVYHFDNVKDDELRAFYKQADLFVYPSIAEGFGIPPIEALSFGLPTLCSNATAMSNFTFLGTDLFDSTNVEELKKKILHKLIHVDPERQLSLKQFVINQYSWKKSAECFLIHLNEEKNRTNYQKY